MPTLGADGAKLLGDSREVLRDRNPHSAAFSPKARANIAGLELASNEGRRFVGHRNPLDAATLLLVVCFVKVIMLNIIL
jgi:hypothetical protein